MKWDILENKTPYEILELFDMKTPPFDPFYIANELGINVKRTLDYDKLNTEGQIRIDENNEPEIWINPIKNEARQRFTLAHELGHLVNDILPNINNAINPIIDKYETLYRSTLFGGIETRANKFAAQLLMPLKPLETYIENARIKQPKLKAKEAIVMISDDFRVSKQAVFHRLQNVGLIKKDYMYPF